jgi:hypothetical protein
MTDASKDDLVHLQEQLNRIARLPTAADLWKLHGTLLACMQDEPDTQLALHVARHFYLYLSELQSKLTARQYNELASRLDIASVGVLALQDILIEHEHLGKSLLLGGIGESLMVMASRQYVRAWEQELRSVQRDAAWTLYHVLWQLSRQYQPEMRASKRRALIDATLEPALDDDASLESRMLLLLRLFQVSLLILLAPFYVPPTE